ncbi:MAG: type I DNA topoisomerase, partial [Cyanobacteria bacterium]|nr:type I DNA topoisomerase [Cyanobacteriota bacterium]
MAKTTNTPDTKSSSPKKPKAKAAATKKPVKAKAKGSAAPELDTDQEDFEKSGKKKSLVIVESPAKAKTIKKILGSAYQIKASVGHIRDLPAKKLGVDVEHDFNPMYEIMPQKADIVAELQALADECDMIYLAPDPDREGEAIAWHIRALLNKPDEKILRIEFHEITKPAILEAIQNPRQIDLSRVDAQQARRILDRLVGYKLSPLLWKKVTKGLSAGRVQSVAVRIICEREEEVQAFVPEEYWTIHTDLTSSTKSKVVFSADLNKVDGKKPEIKNQTESDQLVSDLTKATYTVSALGERDSKRNPVAPFITSTLQREASTRYGYPVKKTMQIAQKLYEGMDLGAEGPVGLITYMR